METCSPASQLGDERAWVTLKATPRGVGIRPGYVTWMVESCVSTSWVCILGLAGGACKEEQERAGEPPWPQPAHQVTKVDVVVQKSQPSTMDMLPACLKGHVAMLGQRQDPVFILGVYVLSYKKSPKFSNVYGPGNRTLPLHVS